MKGINNGVMDEPPVKLHVMGGANQGHWRWENEWPLARTRYTEYYLHDGKSGTVPSLNDGTLNTQKQKKEEQPDAYLHDPKHPTSTIGGNLTRTTPVDKRGPLTSNRLRRAC
ncbi:hypothetical protein skT53_03110 [Effusibacillus dendaii]|uniref:Xaa-Pro dipeptidyl-peptidase C-terminal domain-containing protein n=1 Tax=Effusibacillus dendaii TaxID=2743772 RepID=A0A7I8D931_9BACL|nr:hypothetical protein skT53_03110 [Effusibacillus dendaii]